jgi:hypothetical protein
MSILDFVLRLGAALLMGAAVGLERQAMIILVLPLSNRYTRPDLKPGDCWFESSQAHQRGTGSIGRAADSKPAIAEFESRVLCQPPDAEVDEARGRNPRLTEFESRPAVHGKVSRVTA